MGGSPANSSLRHNCAILRNGRRLEQPYGWGGGDYGRDRQSLCGDMATEGNMRATVRATCGALMG